MSEREQGHDIRKECEKKRKWQSAEKRLNLKTFWLLETLTVK